MLDALKHLFENNVISEEVKADIEAAWNARITENREAVTHELREEFAQRYEHDKSVMLEAVDRMVTDQLREEIAQFVEDRKQLAEAKVKLAMKAKRDAETMKEFITSQLASEIQELHEDQVQMANKFGVLEKFVVEALAQEIAEFHIDKKAAVDTKVRLVREGKEALAKLKDQFIKRAAVMVEETVNQTLTKEITQLREDIEVARQNDFGRKIFEAYSSEYQTSYVNSKSETAKLLKVIQAKELELQEAKATAENAKKILESKEAELKRLAESRERQAIMHELLGPLSKDKKGIMTELLESVQTSKLRSSFEKYLPAVIAGEAKTPRKALVEAKEVTGNKTSSTSSSTEDGNIIDIRRLAGIKH